MDLERLAAHYKDRDSYNLAQLAYHAGYPVDYLLNDLPFLNQIIRVQPGVFIPRPETEWLVAQVITYFGDKAPDYIIDCGTGTGCIAIALAAHFKTARIDAWDSSQRACTLAQANKIRNNSHDMHIYYGDYRQAFDNFTAFNHRLIISNPPYINMQDPALSPAVRLFEPELALDGGGNDGCAWAMTLIQTLAESARESSTTLMLEVGYNQASRIQAYMKHWGYTDCQIYQDYAGHNRAVRGHLW